MVDLAAALVTRARAAVVVVRNERILQRERKEEKNEWYCLQHLSQRKRKKEKENKKRIQERTGKTRERVQPKTVVVVGSAASNTLIPCLLP